MNQIYCTPLWTYIKSLGAKSILCDIKLNEVAVEVMIV